MNHQTRTPIDTDQRQGSSEDLYPSRCEDRARVLPRLDPVVHGTWNAQSPLSRAQTEAFRANGYLILEDIFDPEEIMALQQEAGALLADPSALHRETIITERGGGEVRSIFAIHAQNQLMGRLAADSRLASVAAFLLDDQVYIHQSRLNYKPGFDGKEFYWHSDFETWHVEDGMPRMRALSMSVLLAENTANNGPLMLMPGSQRKYVTCIGETPEDHYRASLKKQEYGVPAREMLTALADEHGIEAPVGRPGTMVIFDCNTMHGSNGNITPFPRSNAFFVYNALSNQLVEPFGPTARRPEFVAARRFEPIAVQAGVLRRGPAT